MDIIEKINEAITKPSFLEFFFNKKNFKKINKEWEDYYTEIARDAGDDIIWDPSYGYVDDEGELDYEVDPIDAYENFAHTTGYMAEQGAAEAVIRHFKNKYDYQKGDETDEEKQDLIIYLNGYTADFRGSSHLERKVKELQKQYS